jgi:hypothetical protein
MGLIIVRFDKTVLVGFALTVSVLAEACTPAAPSSGPSPAPVSPVPQTSPTATGTPSPADIEATLTRIAQFDQQLKQLSAGNPSPNDLVNTAQEVLTQADYVTTYYPQMTTQQRTQALAAIMGILDDEISVVNTHARIFPATATAFAIAHPSPTTPPGTQIPVVPSPQATPVPTTQGATATIVGTGTPTTGASIARQIIGDLDAIRNETVSLASDQPTDQDILNILERLRADVIQLSQQSSSMSDTDMVSVLKDMDRALAYLVPVVQTRTNQERSSIATPTPPPTATPQTTSTPAATSTTPVTSTPGP